MINTLYRKFRHWSFTGSIFIISDTHFDDSDCKYMDPDWPDPQDHINKIKKKVHKTDTLIHLGDVGNPEWLNQIKAYKVLIMGNHDETATKFRPYFDEIYTGPLFIAEKILLSHEPIINGSMWFNIHGHDHNPIIVDNYNSLNLASNVVGYDVFNLGIGIKQGMLKHVDGIHRLTIDNVTRRKNK